MAMTNEEINEVFRAAAGAYLDDLYQRSPLFALFGGKPRESQEPDDTGETLTAKVFDRPARNFAFVPPPLQIIEVRPTPIYAPARRHRKRRVQKKWNKRYGMELVGYERHLDDQVYVHEKTGVAFCHPDVAARLRYETWRMEDEDWRMK